MNQSKLCNLDRSIKCQEKTLAQIVNSIDIIIIKEQGLEKKQTNRYFYFLSYVFSAGAFC